jgi:hypothetical protein
MPKARRVSVRAWVAFTEVTTRVGRAKRPASRDSKSCSNGPKFEYQRLASIFESQGSRAFALGKEGLATRIRLSAISGPALFAVRNKMVPAPRSAWVKGWAYMVNAT